MEAKHEVEQLVKWLMEQDENWMALRPQDVGFMAMANRMVNDGLPSDATQAFNELYLGQPPLPKGEWFSPTTKHAYCVDCGQWQPVKHHWASGGVHCDKCGYLIADFYPDDGGYSADGDIANEYIWDAKTHMYTHVENYGGQMWREDEEVEDYPMPHRPEWVMAAIAEEGNAMVEFEPTPRPNSEASYFASMGGWE